jgi:hypothetical protein
MKFKIGDTVRVDECLSPLMYEGTPVGWDDAMRNWEDCVGTVIQSEKHDAFIAYEIRFIDDNRQDNWWIREEDLTLVSEPIDYKSQSEVKINIDTLSKVVKLRRVDYEFLLEQLNPEQQNLLVHFVETFEEQQ